MNKNINKTENSTQSNSIKDLTHVRVKERLTVGQVFKSFKELCDTLGIKYGNGFARVEKSLNKFFRCEKDGRKIIITEIFDKEDFGDQKYAPYIKKLLYNYFLQSDKIIKEPSVFELTITQLLGICGLVNSKYTSYCNLDIDKFNDFVNMREYNINFHYLYNYIFDWFKKCILGTTKIERNLLNLREVNAVKRIKLIYNSGEDEIIETNCPLYKRISDIRNNLTETLKAESKPIKTKTEVKEFNRLLMDRIKAELGIELNLYYTVYIINSTTLDKSYKLSPEEVQEYKEKLNTNVMEYFCNSLGTKKRQKIEKLSDEEKLMFQSGYASEEGLTTNSDKIFMLMIEYFMTL